MWIYHPFKPGAHDARCIYDLGGVSCGRLENHPIHQAPDEDAEHRAGRGSDLPAFQERARAADAAAALAALAELRREHVGDYAAVDVLLDRIEQALRGDGAA